MSPGVLVALILVASFVFVGTLLAVIFSAVRKSRARALAELAAEGIVLDSGRTSMTFQFRGFRGPMVSIGVGSRSGPGRIVLTQRRFTFFPAGQNRFGFAVMDRAGLGHFRVRVEGQRLHMHSDDPPNGSGTVDVFVSVAAPAAWRDALVAAGARSAD